MSSRRSAPRTIWHPAEIRRTCFPSRVPWPPILRVSQPYGFPQDVLAKPRLETALGGDINPPPQETLQIYHQRGEVEKAPSPLQLNQEVDIALNGRLPASHGPEDADVRGSIPGSDVQDFVALIA